MLLMDLSLLPGMLLDGATFHLTSLFFFNPFKEALFAELYAALRDEKREHIADGELLRDATLLKNPGLERYPDEVTESYEIRRSGDEILITEKVNNLLYQKRE